MKNADIVFNSEQNPNGKSFDIASGYISKTVIYFEKEDVYAEIEAEGSAEFFDAEENSIDKGSVTKEESGRKLYDEISLSVKDGIIRLAFPVCEWIDNYPHCDGEHDRWDKKIIGERVLMFDTKEKSIVK